ncbi:hypothetical protein ACQPXH_27605 [Nocardia sp. CA-135953]|uniref:hypothetical protein n=1 Tax=Nocardia sp. CA-135953 TaxID=3239978 RepID=UPI003D9567BD
MISRSDGPSIVCSHRLPGVLGGEFGDAPLDPAWLGVAVVPQWLAVSRVGKSTAGAGCGAELRWLDDRHAAQL